jgi:pterin-4a-carbinolamine dehydratase
MFHIHKTASILQNLALTTKAKTTLGRWESSRNIRKTRFRFRIFANTFAFRNKIRRKVAEKIKADPAKSCDKRWLHVWNFPLLQLQNKISIIFAIEKRKFPLKAKAKNLLFNSKLEGKKYGRRSVKPQIYLRTLSNNN